MRVHTQSQELPASIIARDRSNDLALLHVNHGFAAPVAFRDGSGIRQAETVVAIGYPYGEKWASGATVTSGSISSLTGPQDDIRFLQFTAPVQPGNSGGPLLDPSGHVVGIVAAKMNRSPAGPASGDVPQNVNMAVKSAVIREFLDTNGVKYRSIPSTTELHSADIASQARQAVVYIECMR
jgi:S1-C subfamily serine protease